MILETVELIEANNVTILIVTKEDLYKKIDKLEVNLYEDLMKCMKDFISSRTRLMGLI